MVAGVAHRESEGTHAVNDMIIQRILSKTYQLLVRLQVPRKTSPKLRTERRAQWRPLRSRGDADSPAKEAPKTIC